MKRLYLTDGGRYRIRHHNARTCMTRWNDDRKRFETGRGAEFRVIPVDSIAAVSEVLMNGRAHVWFPLEDCFRDKHKPTAKRPAPRWVHPYRRAA